jgi:hypothetical protein
MSFETSSATPRHTKEEVMNDGLAGWLSFSEKGMM